MRTQAGVEPGEAGKYLFLAGMVMTVRVTGQIREYADHELVVGPVTASQHGRLTLQTLDQACVVSVIGTPGANRIGHLSRSSEFPNASLGKLPVATRIRSRARRYDARFGARGI